MRKLAAEAQRSPRSGAAQRLTDERRTAIPLYTGRSIETGGSLNQRGPASVM